MSENGQKRQPIRDPHKTRHIWTMVKVEEGIRESPVTGAPGVVYVATSWICHCGETKLVVRKITDQAAPDDPDYLVTKAPPVPLRRD